MQTEYSGAKLIHKPVSLFLLSLAVIAVFGPITYRYYLNPISDYYDHAGFALNMETANSIIMPHFLFHLSSIAINKLITHNDIYLAGIIVAVIFHLFTAVVVYVSSVKYLNLNPYIAMLLTVCLLLVGPIILLAPADWHLYFGYIGINVFHNPTIIVLKPFALLLFFSACKIFNESAESSLQTVFLIVSFTILSAVAKPSFLICMLPALIVTALYKLYRNHPVKWSLLVAGIIVPAIFIMATQYLMTYSLTQPPSVDQGKSSIIVAPFVVMGARSSWLFPKFILSALFPIMVLLCYYREAGRNLQLKFAWLLFSFGVSFTYLLAESGPRLTHGNLGWSGQITLFVLFVISTQFFLKQASGEKMSTFFSKKQNLICAVVFGLHLVSNLIFYRAEFIQTVYFW